MRDYNSLLDFLNKHSSELSKLTDDFDCNANHWEKEKNVYLYGKLELMFGFNEVMVWKHKYHTGHRCLVRHYLNGQLVHFMTGSLNGKPVDTSNQEQKIVNDIVSKLKWTECDFSDIERIFDDWAFDYIGNIGLENRDGCLLWAGWNFEAFEILHKALKKSGYEIYPLMPYAYHTHTDDDLYNPKVPFYCPSFRLKEN